MEVDGSRLLYLESCEGLVSSLKAENEQLEGKLEFTKMAYQTLLSENTKLKSIIESKNKTKNKFKDDLIRAEEDLSIAEEENAQLKDKLKQSDKSSLLSLVTLLSELAYDELSEEDRREKQLEVFETAIDCKNELKNR